MKRCIAVLAALALLVGGEGCVRGDYIPSYWFRLLRDDYSPWRDRALGDAARAAAGHFLGHAQRLRFRDDNVEWHHH
jgi:hypothetical protein